MNRGSAHVFELPDDLVISADDGNSDSDQHTRAGSTLPQNLFAFGEQSSIALAEPSDRDFSDSGPDASVDTRPGSLPDYASVRPAAPEFHVGSMQAIIAPMHPAGRLASDGPQAKRVLVVDDDVTARLYLRSRLMLRGHVELLEVANGAQALELVMTQRFDAILLDIDMGAQNGFEVCRAIRSHVQRERSKQPRIYMVTSRSGVLDKMRAKMAGADAFLSKPPHPGELAELLAQL
jgi:CheY-like chemotaxis protein